MRNVCFDTMPPPRNKSTLVSGELAPAAAATDLVCTAPRFGAAAGARAAAEASTAAMRSSVQRGGMFACKQGS